MAAQSSILAWEISRTGGDWQASPQGSQMTWAQLSDSIRETNKSKWSEKLSSEEGFQGM